MAEQLQIRTSGLNVLSFPSSYNNRFSLNTGDVDKRLYAITKNGHLIGIGVNGETKREYSSWSERYYYKANIGLGLYSFGTASAKYNVGSNKGIKLNDETTLYVEPSDKIGADRFPNSGNLNDYYYYWQVTAENAPTLPFDNINCSRDNLTNVEKEVLELLSKASPTAYAGEDISVTQGETVTLDASKSTANDENKTIDLYVWTDENNTTLAETSSFSKSDFDIGTHTIKLTVYRNDGAMDSDYVDVTIQEGLNSDKLTYGTLTSPYTNRVWLDRNLGASRGCTSVDDESCYGDYYQWGRNSDGHEKSNSETSTRVAINSINPGHSKFITVSNWTFDNFFIQPYDWTYANYDLDGSLRMASWNPCPTGFKVPTKSEVLAESNLDFLNLGYAGTRWLEDGAIVGKGEVLFFWTNSAASEWSNLYATYVWGGWIASKEYGGFRMNRTLGVPVRCINEQ